MAFDPPPCAPCAPCTPLRIPVERRRFRVAAIEKATADIRIVRLDPENGAPLRFRAGQYARVAFDGQGPRDYSMANRPGARRLEFHIRQVSGGNTSAFVVQKLKVGHLAEVEGPHGEAWLRLGHDGPIVAVAGGSGLAPMKAVVETALAAGHGAAIRLYLGVRRASDIYLEDHFRRLADKHANFRFIPVLSEPEAGTAHRTGLVGDAAAADIGALPGAKVYLAGPPAMVEHAVAALRARGLPEADIHADPFYSEAERAARARGERS